LMVVSVIGLLWLWQTRSAIDGSNAGAQSAPVDTANNKHQTGTGKARDQSPAFNDQRPIESSKPLSQPENAQSANTQPTTTAPVASNAKLARSELRKRYQQQRQKRLNEAEIAELHQQKRCRDVPTSIGAFADDVKHGNLIAQQWSEAMQQALAQGNAAVLALIDQCQSLAQSRKEQNAPDVKFEAIDWTLYPELVSELPREELKALKSAGDLQALQLVAEMQLDSGFTYLHPTLLDGYADLRMIQILGGKLSALRERQLADVRSFIAAWRIRQLEAQALQNAKEWR
jgi:hypothetical protein